MKNTDDLLREASDLLRDLWNASGPKTGGEQYPNMLNVIDMHQQIEAHFARLDRATATATDSVVLLAANPEVRTDRILDALFGDRGGTVIGRMSMPYHPAMRQQVPSGKKMGIGVNEEDYRDGGL